MSTAVQTSAPHDTCGLDSLKPLLQPSLPYDDLQEGAERDFMFGQTLNPLTKAFAPPPALETRVN